MLEGFPCKLVSRPITIVKTEAITATQLPLRKEYLCVCVCYVSGVSLSWLLPYLLSASLSISEPSSHAHSSLSALLGSFFFFSVGDVNPR